MSFITKHKRILLASAGLSLLWIASMGIHHVLSLGGSDAHRGPDPFAHFNLNDPAQDFLLLRYVGEKGGDESLRSMAVEWLDKQVRLSKALEPKQEDWLLTLIENGGHPDWDIEYKLWMFNSGFNCLHLGQDQERLTRLLMNLTTAHPHKTMRLYALQHIAVQRAEGRLIGKLADEVRATLKEIAQEEQSEVAGTALVNLIRWEGANRQPAEEILQLALSVAADAHREADVRVTALHAAAQHGLELARTTAVDVQQPIFVRRAAIATIGQYGNVSDTEALLKLSQENFRMAQAAEPALKSIQNRTHEAPQRKLIQL